METYAISVTEDCQEFILTTSNKKLVVFYRVTSDYSVGIIICLKVTFSFSLTLMAPLGTINDFLCQNLEGLTWFWKPRGYHSTTKTIPSLFMYAGEARRKLYVINIIFRLLNHLYQRRMSGGGGAKSSFEAGVGSKPNLFFLTHRSSSSV